MTPIRIPESLIETLPPQDVSLLSIEATVRIGAKWLAERRSAVLKVPSVIIPAEHNYILNPAHPDFQDIVFLAPEPFHFDPRLKQAAG